MEVKPHLAKVYSFADGTWRVSSKNWPNNQVRIETVFPKLIHQYLHKTGCAHPFLVKVKDNLILFSWVFYDEKVAKEMIKKLRKAEKKLNFIERKELCQ